MANKLSMSDVAAEVREKDDPLIEGAYEMGARAAQWKMSLAGAVSRGYCCKVIFSTASKYSHKPTAYVYFIGRKADVEVAWYMFGYLANTITELAKKNFRDTYEKLVLEGLAADAVNLNATVWENDFRMGAIAVLGNRLRQTEEVFVKKHDECRAVMVRSHAEVAEFYVTCHLTRARGSLRS